MAIAKEGEYLGKYKSDGTMYHMFSPAQIVTEGDLKYVRIGDYYEEFGTSRRYILINVNDEEQKLIDKSDETI